MRTSTITMLLFVSLSVSATNADLQQATSVAISFAESAGINMSITPGTVNYITSDEITLAYVFSGEKNGYVVIAADKRINPVICFSESGTLYEGSPLWRIITADVKLRLEHTDSRCQEIKHKVAEKWQGLLPGQKQQYNQWPQPGTTSTGGWIETLWHQDFPYNKFTPVNLSSGQRTLVGCPATAIAQILNYHRQINNTRFGSEDRYLHNYQQQFWIDDDWQTYDFLSFDSLNVYLENIEAGFEKKTPLTQDEKAALSLAAGFASKTVYTPEVSGTFGVAQAYDAYQKFGFQNSVLLNHSYSDQYIREKIIDNIKNGLPVHLAVVDANWQSGHNVIVDGYRDNGFFRINMGWGGTHDNWYSLPEGFPYNLTVFEGVIADINIPAEVLFTVGFQVEDINEKPIIDAHIQINDPDILLVTDQQGYTQVDLPNGNYSFTVLLDGTQVHTGSFIIDNDHKVILVQNIETSIYSNDNLNLVVYPNPFHNNLNINSSQPLASISLWDLQGQAVMIQTPLHQAVETITMTLSDILPGYYIIKIETTNKRIIEKKVLKVK